MPKRPSHYRPDIQVLRAIAVMAVVIFHAKREWSPQGYLGVDMFFVISGFVVTPLMIQIFRGESNFRNRLTGLRTFFIRRFMRLTPALATTLVISFFAVGATCSIEDLRRLAKQALSTLLLLGNVGAYRFTGDYFGQTTNPLIHTWSLSVEEQIYIVLPLILILLVKSGRSITKQVFVIQSLIAITSISIFIFADLLAPLYEKIGIGIPRQFSFYSPVSRVWEFCLGGLIYALIKKYGSPALRARKSLNLLIAAGFVLLFAYRGDVSSEIGALVACALCSLAITLRTFESLPSSFAKIGEWLGDRSYSIYLVHMPLIFIATTSPYINHTRFNNLGVAITVCLSLLLGSLNYSKVENRFRYALATPGGSTTLKKSVVAFALIPAVLFFGTISSYPRVAFAINSPNPSPIAPWAWDENCQILIGKKNPDCTYSSSDSKGTLYVIGDSHAASISKTATEVAQKYNLITVVATSPGCALFLPKDDKDLAGQILSAEHLKGCYSYNSALIKELKRVKPIAVLYTSASRDVYAPTDRTPKSGELINRVVLKNLRELRQSINHVIVVGQVPERTTPTLFDLLIQRDMQRTGAKKDSDFWRKNANESGFSFIETYPLFCEKDVCINHRNGQWLYQDGDHLSLAGAQLLAPALSKILRGLSAN